MSETPLRRQDYERVSTRLSRKPRPLGPMAAAIILLLICAGLTLPYIYHNQRNFQLNAERLRNKWSNEISQGLDPDKVTRLKHHLSNLEHQHFGPIPAYWFSKLTGIQQQLHSLHEQTKTVWSQALGQRKYQALAALSHLKKTEGSYFGPNKPYQDKLNRAKTPKDYENLTNTWTKKNQKWLTNLANLKKISGGFSNHLPADIVSDENSLNELLNKLSSQSADRKKGNAILEKTERYLNMSPSGELKQHSEMKQELQSVIDTMKKDEILPVSSNQWLFNPKLTDYIQNRSGQISIAVFNADNGHTYLYQPELQYDTASIVKVSIMADLLYQEKESGHPLSQQEKSLMVPMIENSSNSAASKLWEIAGGASGIKEILNQARMTETLPGKGGEWGLTKTTARDQVKLMRLFAYPNSVLDSSQREYGLNLMEHIISWEKWGVSGGIPAGETIALKNGWLPYPSKWWINSIGYVAGAGRNYVIAVLTGGNATKQYGIDTINHISNMIWDRLGEQ